jgi:hypothetical protein
MASNFDDISAAEALNLEWDRRALGQMSAADSESVDVASLAKLMACDDAPLPNETFKAQLRLRLTAQEAKERQVPRPSRVGLSIVHPYPSPWPLVSARRFLFAVGIAACLMLALSAGGGLFHDQAHAPVIASVLASPEETATAGPTMTAWIRQTRAVPSRHDVTLLPHLDATATQGDHDVLPPSTVLTIVEVASDGTGQQWLHVQTNDGRAGWLPQSDTSPLEE